MTTTIKTDFETKLDTLLIEMKRDVMKRFKSNEAKPFSHEFDDEFFDFMKDKHEGKLIDMKRHGIILLSMVCGELVEKC